MDSTSSTQNAVEKWRAIPGFPGYKVSNFGRLKSYKRRGEPLIMSTPANAYGYPATSLVVTKGKSIGVRVHQLVLLAFVGPCPDGYETGHLDNVRHNNWLGNLKYVTPKENHSHQKIFGTEVSGSRHPKAILNEALVAEARKVYARGGETFASLAKKYGVHRNSMGDALTGKHWKSVPML